MPRSSRTDETPMRAIAKGLPRQPKKEGHFAAMPYSRVPAFVPRLRERESYSRLALEFAILTAARSGEVRHAEFDEFDLSAGLWTIPAQKMKAGREHVVPLCARAARIIKRCAELRIRNCPLVFPGMHGFKPMSDMTLTKLLREMKEPYTVHGFRSAFRDWVSEERSTQSAGDLSVDKAVCQADYRVRIKAHASEAGHSPLRIRRGFPQTRNHASLRNTTIR
ncbi:tyrosine-type recombinase/integrase [Pelagerythrobacter marinus]|uniref:tyrosine-type recombinase/integrase n=1 Tax=Pelagerythrobacter marinus TaxID=538382 RepID=UPI002AC8E027|nr:tyrosine-type recombinase/integrase [Pelagerythrobacter marinus]WPZ07561.1 tyrosine-type recombinase/integrase [Pelagerythrobacter marinus]